MTKEEIVKKMAEDAGITIAKATDALNSFMDAVEKTLKKKMGR